MSYDPEREIERYLERLSSAAHDLPRARRGELLGEIEQHIRQALAEQPCANEAELLTLLDQVGDPGEIAAAAGDEPAPSGRPTAMEIAAIVLLLVGGFLFLVGWFAGVALLWSSSLWTRREKLLGTLVIPGGLATAVLCIQLVLIRGVGGSGTSTVEVVGITAGLVLVLVAPLATAVYLSRRLNERKQRPVEAPAAAVG